MKLIKPVLWTVLGVVIGVAATLTAARLEAQGTVKGITACTPVGHPTPVDWMNAQIASGRNRFIQFGSSFCAW